MTTPIPPGLQAEIDRRHAQLEHGIEATLDDIRRNRANGMDEQAILAALIVTLTLHAPTQTKIEMLAVALMRLSRWGGDK